MPQVNNILFSVDFPDRTCSAASFVVVFMKLFGAKATILRVMDAAPSNMDRVPARRTRDSSRQISGRKMDRLRGAL
jgi:hypothetical protein